LLSAALRSYFQLSRGCCDLGDRTTLRQVAVKGASVFETTEFIFREQPCWNSGQHPSHAHEPTYETASLKRYEPISQFHNTSIFLIPGNHLNSNEDCRGKSSSQQDEVSYRQQIGLKFKEETIKCYIWSEALYGDEA
jgi:hypothetical protein